LQAHHFDRFSNYVIPNRAAERWLTVAASARILTTFSAPRDPYAAPAKKNSTQTRQMWL
jgi:hypothetical protein